MKIQTTKEYISSLEEGVLLSVVDDSFKVLAANVKPEELIPSNVEIGVVRWPKLKGGKFDGNRIFHHTKETSEGEFVLFGHGY